MRTPVLGFVVRLYVIRDGAIVEFIGPVGEKRVSVKCKISSYKNVINKKW